MPTPACLTVDRQPQWIRAEIVSANFFDLLGVRPILGRTFLPDEDRKPGGNPVLVISERLWRAKFGGAPSIVGRTVDLNRLLQFRSDLGQGQCELLEQLRHKALPLFTTRNLSFSATCTPHQVTLGSIRFSVDVLRPAPQPGAGAPAAG